MCIYAEEKRLYFICVFIVCLLFTTEQKMPAKLEGLYDLTTILDSIVYVLE